MPEPAEFPDGSYALVGEWPHQDLYTRRDDTAKVPGWGERHWFPIDCDGDPVTWARLHEPRWDGYGRRPMPVVELVPRDVVDRMVEAARKAAQVTPVGEHLKEASGWCRTCSIQHHEPEWARIHDQIAAEAEVSDG